MVAVHDRRGGVVGARPGAPEQSTPRTRRTWVAPTWERLETPMEVTMYAGRR